MYSGPSVIFRTLCRVCAAVCIAGRCVSAAGRSHVKSSACASGLLKFLKLKSSVCAACRSPIKSSACAAG
eukprot:1160787-Pelagomonas_calceolata.AAC.3